MVDKTLFFEKMGVNSADPAKRFSRPRRFWGKKSDILIRSKTYLLTILKMLKKKMKCLVVFFIIRLILFRV